MSSHLSPTAPLHTSDPTSMLNVSQTGLALKVRMAMLGFHVDCSSYLKRPECKNRLLGVHGGKQCLGCPQ
eukprot:9480127-Pyramimonas_sp.AAC.2